MTPLISHELVVSAIVASFKNEVSYIQSSFFPDDYEGRRHRWMSISIILGHLKHNLQLPDDIDRLVGLDARALRRFKP